MKGTSKHLIFLEYYYKYWRLLRPKSLKAYEIFSKKMLFVVKYFKIRDCKVGVSTPSRRSVFIRY